MSILLAEMAKAAESQKREAEGQTQGPTPYVNDYSNYGNWYDCSGWH